MSLGRGWIGCFLVLVGLAACGKADEPKPPAQAHQDRFRILVDINDDGVADAADEQLALAGRPELMRWYEPVLNWARQPDKAGFTPQFYAQPLSIEFPTATAASAIVLESPLGERLSLFADAACTRKLASPVTPPVGSRQMMIYLLALPKDAAPQPAADSSLKVSFFPRWPDRNAHEEAALSLHISGTALPNAGYFDAVLDYFAEASGKQLPPLVYSDRLYRDSAEPFRVVVMRPEKARLQVIDATGLGKDEINAWRPNVGVSIKNIKDAVRKFPAAVAIVNGTYFHTDSAVAPSYIAKWSETPLLEDGREWTPDPDKWSKKEAWWGDWHGCLAQRKDGSLAYQAAAKGWPENARSGVSGLKAINWDAAPHTLIGVARLNAPGAERAPELLVLLCGETMPPKPERGFNNKLNARLSAVKESLGLVFLGALDGGGSNAMAYADQNGALRIADSTVGGRHDRDNGEHINNYLAFFPRE